MGKKNQSGFNNALGTINTITKLISKAVDDNGEALRMAQDDYKITKIGSVVGTIIIIAICIGIMYLRFRVFGR